MKYVGILKEELSMVIGTLVEVINEAGAFHSRAMNAIAEPENTSNRVYGQKPEKMSSRSRRTVGSNVTTSKIPPAGPKTGTLADKMLKARYAELSKRATAVRR